MLIPGENISTEIKRSQSVRLKNAVSPIFYNVGKTAFTVNKIPCDSNNSFIGFTNDHLLLKNAEFNIEFEQNSDKQNKIILVFQEYDLSKISLEEKQEDSCL
jgi:hypothetical protein